MLDGGISYGYHWAMGEPWGMEVTVMPTLIRQIPIARLSKQVGQFKHYTEVQRIIYFLRLKKTTFTAMMNAMP